MTTEQAIQFASWASDRLRSRKRLELEDVMARFDCPRSTAYRWIGAYYDAMGLPRPEKRNPCWDVLVAA